MSWHFELPVNLEHNPTYTSVVARPTSRSECEEGLARGRFATMGDLVGAHTREGMGKGGGEGGVEGGERTSRKAGSRPTGDLRVDRCCCIAPSRRARFH